MFWVFAFIFWFSLLFGTYMTGNTIGNWIALFGLVLFIRWHREIRSRASTERSETTNGAQPASKAPVFPPTPPAVSHAQRDTPRTARGPALALSAS